MDETQFHAQESKASRAPSTSWPLVLAVMLTVLLALGLLTLYLAPVWAERWRVASDQASAEAVYLRRQAELRAESEAADQRLEILDRRVHLVSLGFRDVARKVAPVVVHIGNEVAVEEEGNERSFHDDEDNREYVEHAEGSGILVKPGLVLTNRHVVDKAKRLRVTFASGRSLKVKPANVSSDQPTDLAVIRLPQKPGIAFEPDYAVYAEFADSDRDVQVGDWVLAAGSPFGLRQTVSAGIISAKGRTDLRILDFVDLLQTDAAINPGSSGGPLFDARGRVVGINVAIASESGRSQGVGFAIPSDTVQEVFNQLVEKGEVVRGFLGVYMNDVREDAHERLGVAGTGGVFVTRVESNSPADNAGLQKGDLIVRVNGEPVGTGNAMSRLRKRIAQMAPETHVQIEVLRHGEKRALEVVVAKRPAPR
jgi:serine protease Do